MIELYNLNISDETINEMIEMEPELKDINSEEIKEKELILDELGCDKKQINNIISSNPTYLTRTNEEILNLIKKLKEYNFTTLDILFDSNPYILSLESFEIEPHSSITSDECVFNMEENKFLIVSIYIKDYVNLTGGVDIIGPLSKEVYARPLQRLGK